MQLLLFDLFFGARRSHLGKLRSGCCIIDKVFNHALKQTKDGIAGKMTTIMFDDSDNQKTSIAMRPVSERILIGYEYTPSDPNLPKIKRLHLVKRTLLQLTEDAPKWLVHYVIGLIFGIIQKKYHESAFQHRNDSLLILIQTINQLKTLSLKEIEKQMDEIKFDNEFKKQQFDFEKMGNIDNMNLPNGTTREEIKQMCVEKLQNNINNLVKSKQQYVLKRDKTDPDSIYIDTQSNVINIREFMTQESLDIINDRFDARIVSNEQQIEKFIAHNMQMKPNNNNNVNDNHTLSGTDNINFRINTNINEQEWNPRSCPFCKDEPSHVLQHLHEHEDTLVYQKRHSEAKTVQRYIFKYKRWQKRQLRGLKEMEKIAKEEGDDCLPPSLASLLPENKTIDDLRCSCNLEQTNCKDCMDFLTKCVNEIQVK